MNKIYILLISIVFSIKMTFAQSNSNSGLSLYGHSEIPYATISQEELSEDFKPKIFPYIEVKDAKDIIFLVIPGGGYARVAINHEGFDVAKRLNENQYKAYVLQYRLPNDSTMTNKEFVPLQDAIAAVQVIRKENPDKKVAVIGFSAGGHLAAMLSNVDGSENIKTEVDVPTKVDYSILVYPVISMQDSITHKGSQQNLLGPNVDDIDKERFSINNRVSSDTPPTFLVHARDDKGVVIENSLLYKKMLDNSGVENQIFLYETGGHGFGMINKTEDRDWLGEMINWITEL